MISAEEVRAVLDYEPETGVFRWKGYRRGSHKNHGDIAGYLSSAGYKKINLKGTEFAAHKLAWLLMTGEMPGLIDHINGEKTDNRFANLRLADPSQSSANRRGWRSGLKGVYPLRRSVGFAARISFRKKQIYLGTYATEAEAHRMYAAAAKYLHREFARTS